MLTHVSVSDSDHWKSTSGTRACERRRPWRGTKRDSTEKGEIPHKIHERRGLLVVLGEIGGREIIPTRQFEMVGATTRGAVGEVLGQDIVAERHVGGRPTDLGDVDEPEWNPQLAAHEVLDLTDIGPARRGGLPWEIEVDEGQPQSAGRELVQEAEVDVLVVPALGWHGVDETDLDTRE